MHTPPSKKKKIGKNFRLFSIHKWKKFVALNSQYKAELNKQPMNQTFLPEMFNSGSKT